MIRPKPLILENFCRNVRFFCQRGLLLGWSTILEASELYLYLQAHECSSLLIASRDISPVLCSVVLFIISRVLLNGPISLLNGFWCPMGVVVNLPAYPGVNWCYSHACGTSKLVSSF